MSNPNQKAKNSLNKGIVVGVPSGDTLVIVKLGDSSSKKGTDRPARLTEIELTLQGIKAPLLALYTQQTKKRDDKPFAWQSREYLRKKVIGQPVAYTVTKGFGNNTGRRQYGQAFVGDKFNVDLRDEVVANGWASVIESSQGIDQKGPRNDGGDNGRRIQGISHLLELQKKAKDEHRGIWNAKMENHSIRQIIHKYDAFDLFDRLKGRHIPALVEQVRSGTTLKLYLPETGHNLPLLLSGVQSPVYKYLNAEEEQEPYAREARFFTELRVLHRDVDVVLEGLDKAGNFFGTVLCNGANLSVQLLKEGLARFVEWSAAKTSNVNELKKAEDDAKAKHSGLWKQQRAEAKDNSNQKPKQKGKQSNDFIGKVIEIVNAGTISVVDEKNPGVEVRVTFSSIQVPRLLSRERMRDPEVDEEDRHNAAYAWEGKEYLRKKLIGQKVKCVLDYVRPPFKDGNQTLPEKPFYGVYFDKKNVAVDLVEKGFATVLEHKGSENRSPDYEEMVLAENKSKKKGVGLHGPKSKKPIRHYTDLTLKELEEDPNAAKDASAAKLTEKQIQEKLDQAAVAKLQQHLPHLTRAGKIPATVEKVYTGCRFKLWVEKESCIIPFVLHSIRCEKMVQTGRNPPSFDPAKSVGNKAYQFAKDLLYQHDVEIIVDSVDKRGNFVGMLTVGGKKDFATLLLEDGLASVFHPSASRTKGLPYEEYKMAENNAKSAKKGVWENYDEAAEEARKQAAIAKRNEERGNAQKKGAEILNVELTEIINGSQFFYQIVGEEKQALEQMMKDFNAQNLDETKADPSFQPKAGDFISAKFTGDDTWYRASVNKALDDGTYDVYYIDYGNSELLEKDRIRPLQKDFGVNVLPAQAHEGKLAYIRTPSVDDDYGADAAAFLREMAWGKKMVANVQHHEGNVTHLVLGDPETQVHVNAALLKAGLAIVVRGRPNPLMSKLREQEQQAKKNRVNLWQYGDLPESDEE